MATSVTSGGDYLRYELKGAAKLRRTLRQAGDDLSDLKDANARAARIVEPVAKSKVPVKTGRLASTIRSSGTKTAGVIRAGRKAVPYAGVIHFGWPARNIPARPFIADAAKQTEPAWGQIYAEAVNKAISRIQGA